jgi:hypothetical protein
LQGRSDARSVSRLAGAVKIRLKIDDRFSRRGQLLLVIGIRTAYLADIGIQLPAFMHDQVAALDPTVTLAGRENDQFLVGMDVPLETTADGHPMNFHIGIRPTLFGNCHGIALDFAAHPTTNQEFSAKFDGPLNREPIIDNRQKRFLSAQG